MRPPLPLRVALWLLPRQWRATVQADIDDEARAEARGTMWRTWQVLRMTAPLRWVTGGHTMMTDLRYTIRSLARSPWFTASAVAIFALGIGVNVAVFSAVDRVLFRPLPYAAPQELVLLRQCTDAGECGGSFPSALAHAAQTRLTTLGEMAIAGLPETWSPRDTPDGEGLTLIGISPNLLRVLGVRPALGRDVVEDDVQAKRRVAFLSHEMWRARFASDPGVIGAALQLGQNSAEIIGILPRGFVQPGWAAQIWDGLIVEYAGWATIRPTGGVNPPIARLRPGFTLDQARAEVMALAAAVEAAAPPARQPWSNSIRVDSLERHLFSRYSNYAWLVVVAAGAVLLMACANLAGLLLARGRSRETDAALRTALGASSTRVVGSAVLESLLICALGAVATLILLVASTGALRALLPPIFSQYATGVADARVLAFAFGVAAICAVIAGAWPGALATRVDLLSTLQRGGERTGRARLRGGRALLIVEACVGVVLVIGCLTALRSFSRLVNEDLGFQPADLYRVHLPTPKVDATQALVAYTAKLEALRGLPGVADVCGSDSVVSDPATAMRGFSTNAGVRGAQYEVTANYFRCLGSRLRAGREFSDNDVRERAAVAVLNVTAARMVWPDKTPAEVVGEALVVDKQPTRIVIGVAPDLKEYYGETARPSVFVPLGTAPAAYSWALVRTTPGAAPDRRTLDSLLASLGGSATSRSVVVAAGESVDAITDDPRFRAVLMTTLGVVGLILAAAGLYALAGFELARRRQEAGVRLALGAAPGQVQRQFVADAVRPVITGIVAGIAVSYWLTSYVQSFLYHTEARDPLTFALAGSLLLAAAVLAAWLPARRIGRVDPAKVLRAT